jgi:acetylornithine/N-succinyldiaminopimelate aminotransferase
MTNPIIPFYKQSDKFLVRSKGCYQFDLDGKQYIDFESGDWAANLGHSHDKINHIIKNQVDLLIHDGLRFRNKPSEDLSIRILEKLSVEGGKSVFLNSGSEAVNLGIRIARNLTKRNTILKMDCSFLSSFGYGQISSDNNDLISIPMDSISSISQINFKEIAAFVFEPGNAWGLIKFPSKDFITSIAFEVKKNGGLLMVNEVTTGFGRTGKWFGFQHYDFKPDIISTGKALGNGYPISCVSISREVSDLFDKNHFRYAQSHQNDALGCAVGLGVINIFDEEQIIQKSQDMGEYFQEQLLMLKSNHKAKIKEIRARGLMLAIEFESIIDVEDIYLQLIEDGFLIGFKDKVIRFMPPLIIERFLIDKLIEALDKVLMNKK